MNQRMKKLDIQVLKRDIDPILEYLGKAACFQFDFPSAAERNDASAHKKEESRAGTFPAPDHEMDPRTDYRALRDGVENAAEFLGLPLRAAEKGSKGLNPEEECALPGQAERELAEDILSRASQARSALERNAAAIATLRESLEEVRAFAVLGTPFSELEHLTFISLRIGRADPEKIPALKSELGERAFVVRLDDQGSLVAVSSKKGRFALDSCLKQAGFTERKVPTDVTGVPQDAISAMEAEELRLIEERKGLEAQRAFLADEVGPRIPCLREGYAMAAAIEDIKARLDSTEHVYFLRGWAERRRMGEMVRAFERITDGRLSGRSFEPEEVASVKEGREKVPVSLRHGKFVAGFERLVFSYGTPLYGSVDPTPFVAFWFVLFFSLMFGDVGQGAVILLAGFLLVLAKSGKRKILSGLRKFSHFSPILLSIGVGSMLMGFLEGSFFTNEETLVPLTRMVSRALLGREMDRFLSLIPTQGVGKILAFFLFSVVMGVLVNSIGLVINMVNLAKAKRFGRMLFSKTGLSGALLFWYALAVGTALALGAKPSLLLLLPLAVPVVMLFFTEPLERLVDGHRPILPDGFMTFVIQGAVEILESVSYYISNTVSFLRVGAFALAHAVLAFVVFEMADLVRAGAPIFGPIGQVLILVIGNTIILVLEGMVVTIQVIRLQYYEFFSKFFTETGAGFAPFSFKGIRLDASTKE